ncbi:MAG: tetratricopeptide repeat protein [Deltaproteobacteria bacterium]|nr:tetratricopeptide repeat protein [Deltaproteobacteria bacterium]
MPWLAGLLLLTLLPAGCTHNQDLAARELELLRREVALLKAERARDLADARREGARPATASPRAATPAGPAVAARPPDPGAPPPLPVVKLDPTRDPFAGGKEPTIRIGKGGREAPPAKARVSEAPLEYDHIDEYGNLVDGEGRIVYKAGSTSPTIDTETEAEVEPGFEDPHESPRARIDRAMQVPRVYDPKQHRAAEVRPGLEALDGGPPPEGARSAPQRLRQLVIGDPELSPDRHRNIVVDDSVMGDDDAPIRIGQSPPPLDEPAPAPVARPVPLSPAAEGAPPAAPESDDEPPIHVTPPPAAPEVVSAPAPAAAPPAQPAVPPAPAVSLAPPERAPGPQRPTTQRSYRGKAERQIQALYASGIAQVEAHDLEGAAATFKKLLARHSDHELADNALYWLAETAYSAGNWAQANVWFQDVILRYPEGNKMPDAMLKSALCYARLGDTSYAVQMLTEVEALFATAPVAEVARQRRLLLSEGDDG